MKPPTKTLMALIGAASFGAGLYLAANSNRNLASILNPQALAQQLPTHQAGAAKDGGVVVELCDGVTKMEVPGLKPGQAMSHEQALAVTHQLMADWEAKHPDQHWQMAQGQDDNSKSSSEWSDETNSPEQTPSVQLLPGAVPTFPAPAAENSPAANSSPIVATGAKPSPVAANTPASAKPETREAADRKSEAAAEQKKAETSQKSAHASEEVQEERPGQRTVAGPGAKQLPVQQGDTYASFNQHDFKIWQAATDRFVDEGKQVFHDANKLGGTIGVSCDMCHPDGSNTHPETYPKYQAQLQRVALLRDMIEWCIENPVKGKSMDPNDPRLRALEAYILAQRKGVPLQYGKH